MGMRFKKSISLGSGAKLNLNKSSISMSVGKKGARYTVNSKGHTTTTVGIPGTGVYYTSTSGDRTDNCKDTDNISESDYAPSPNVVDKTANRIGNICLILAIPCLGMLLSGNLLLIILGVLGFSIFAIGGVVFKFTAR